MSLDGKNLSFPCLWEAPARGNRGPSLACHFVKCFCKALMKYGYKKNLKLVLQVHTDHCMSNRGSSEVLAGWWGQGAQKLPPQPPHCQGTFDHA